MPGLFFFCLCFWARYVGYETFDKIDFFFGGGGQIGSEVVRVKDKRLVKHEARNDAEKREVGQWSEGRNVTAICDM